MGSIALLAKEQGHEVSGSDQNVYPPMSNLLTDAGIELKEGFHPQNLSPRPDMVIIGNANLPRGNAAVEYVLDQGIDYTSGAEWLGRYLLRDRWVIAVAGTHGKTTTTSMIAWILEYAGMEPGFLIGGVPANFSESARLGKTAFFVIEADEYDTSYFDRRSKFLHYRPRTTVLNNLEFDHADIFPDLTAIQNQFHLLLRSIPHTGLVIHPREDKNLQLVIDRGCWTPEETFSTNPASDAEDSYWRSNVLTPGSASFEVLQEGKSVGNVDWMLSGEHNMHNALAAIAAARHVGVKAELSIEALCKFKNVKRRMEVIFESTKLKVYDDFAHHPTAIETTLSGLRDSVGKEGVLAIIEPGSYSMRNGTHQHTLHKSILSADFVIWYKPNNLSWDMETHVNGENAAIETEVAKIVSRTLSLLDTGEYQHLIIMTNGAFGGIQKLLTQALKNR